LFARVPLALAASLPTAEYVGRIGGHVCLVIFNVFYPSPSVCMIAWPHEVAVLDVLRPHVDVLEGGERMFWQQCAIFQSQARAPASL
jgi:hypothetical protein